MAKIESHIGMGSGKPFGCRVATRREKKRKSSSNSPSRKTESPLRPTARNRWFLESEPEARPKAERPAERGEGERLTLYYHYVF